MSVTSPPDTDSRIVAGLGIFCGAFLRRGDVEPVVIRGYVNRVSKPKVPDYVLVTPMTMTRLATNNHQWDAEAGVQSVTQPTRRRVQIDCYGNNAAVWAKPWPHCCGMRWAAISLLVMVWTRFLWRILRR